MSSLWKSYRFSYCLQQWANEVLVKFWGCFFLFGVHFSPQRCSSHYPHQARKPCESSWLCVCDQQACPQPPRERPVAQADVWSLRYRWRVKVSSPACWEAIDGKEVAGGRHVLTACWTGRAAAPVERQGSTVTLSKMLSSCPCKLCTCLAVWKVFSSGKFEVPRSVFALRNSVF